MLFHFFNPCLIKNKRTLSWEGAEFQTIEVPLDEHQRQVYDRGVRWWTQCKNDLQEAL